MHGVSKRLISGADGVTVKGVVHSSRDSSSGFPSCSSPLSGQNSIGTHSYTNERTGHPDREASQGTHEWSATHEDGASRGGPAFTPTAASLAPAGEGKHLLGEGL